MVVVLPPDIIAYIYEFDSTYRDIFTNRVLPFVYIRAAGMACRKLNTTINRYRDTTGIIFFENYNIRHIENHEMLLYMHGMSAYSN